MQQCLMKSLSPGNLFSGVLELKDLVQRLPARINKIIDAIANNELKLSVDAIDEKTLVVGFQKVANRITVGLIIAALIVGAAMLMRVETSFRIWGYPGLAILLFLVAAGGGVVLLINILFYDKGGNGVELYWDRPKELWPFSSSRELAMFSRPLDLDDLLRAKNE
jgi:ubiquinone biosynthesis protein